MRSLPLLSAGLLAVAGSWMLAALFWMDAITGSRLSPGALVLLFPLSYLLNRGLRHPSRGKRWLPAVNMAASALAMLGMVWWQLYSRSPLLDGSWLFTWLQGLLQVYQGFNSEALLVLAAAVLWWQGARLSEKSGAFAHWAAEFQFGVALWVLLLLASRLMERHIPWGSLLLALFLLSSLLGMSFSHLGEGPRFRLWGWLFAALSGGVFLAGLAGALLVTPGVVQELSRWLLLPLQWLWAGIVWLLDLLARLLPGEPSSIPPELAAPPPPPAEEESFRLFAFPPWLKSLLRGGWTMLILGLVLAALWRLAADLVARLGRLGASSGETVEPMPGALGEDLRGLLRRALSWLRSRLLRGRRASPAVSSGIASIRVLYRELLRRAARAGHPRLPFYTPLEYLHHLQGVFPELSGELEWVTRSYLPARYGGQRSIADGRFTLEQKWSTIKARLSQKGSKGK